MPQPKMHEIVWQDREVRFDSLPEQMQCRKGEMVIDSINSVEDTKGNNGERGWTSTYLFLIVCAQSVLLMMGQYVAGYMLC